MMWRTNKSWRVGIKHGIYLVISDCFDGIPQYASDRLVTGGDTAWNFSSYVKEEGESDFAGNLRESYLNITSAPS